jgi:alpha-1,3-rhamnosyltransferase
MTEGAHPLVSIIIASYNHAEYVEKAIQSVLNQTYSNIQLIVIDDASTDNSSYKIKEIQEQANFLFLQNEKNMGLPRSLDKAMREVRGDCLGLLASDDMILPEKIERQVIFLQQHDLDGVYASGYLLYPDNRQVQMDLGRVEQMFREGKYLEHIRVCDTYGAMFQSGLFRTDALKALSYIRERFWSDDWAVTMKLVENYRIGFLNESVFLYRLHDANIHKNYWNSFPGRVQVVSLLTPLELRHTALSNLLASQADYLMVDHQHTLAKRFYLASLAMDFRFEKLTHIMSILNCHPAIWLSRCQQYILRLFRKVLLLPKRIL